MIVIENEINKRGFELYTQLSVVDDNSQRLTIEEDDARIKLAGEVCLGTFKIAEDEYIKYTHSDLLGNAVDITCEIKGKKISYNELAYKNLIDLAIRFLDIDYFDKFADYEFIAKLIFDWIVDLYDKSRAEYELYTYVKNEVEKELNSYTYYFKVHDLIIQDEFKVGNSTFTFKKGEYFESVFDELASLSDSVKPGQKSNFINSHKAFLNTVLICSTITASKAKAELLIKKEIELSVNAVKCLLIPESFQPKTELFNVDYLSMNHTMSSYFSVTDSVKNFRMHLESKTSRTPITIDNARLMDLGDAGLHTLNSFLIHKKNTELYYRTELQINLLGEINSTMDLYSRIIKMISYFENLIIPVTNLSGKGQTYMKNIITKVGANDKEQFTKAVNKMYDIRDKYLHNRNKLPIEYRDLLSITVLAVLFLLEVVDTNDRLNTVEELQLEFGIQNKVKDKQH